MEVQNQKRLVEVVAALQAPQSTFRTNKCSLVGSERYAVCLRSYEVHGGYHWVQQAIYWYSWLRPLCQLDYFSLFEVGEGRTTVKTPTCWQVPCSAIEHWLLSPLFAAWISTHQCYFKVDIWQSDRPVQNFGYTTDHTGRTPYQWWNWEWYVDFNSTMNPNIILHGLWTG